MSHSICTYNGCDKQPTYCYKGEKARFCSVHKHDGMIDILHKKCAHENCNTRPSYNAVGQTRGLYCTKHKLDGMIDVLNKKCVHAGCTHNPHYNHTGKKQDCIVLNIN